MALTSKQFIDQFRSQYRKQAKGVYDRSPDEDVYNAARKLFPLLSVTNITLYP